MQCDLTEWDGYLGVMVSSLVVVAFLICGFIREFIRLQNEADQTQLQWRRAGGDCKHTRLLLAAQNDDATSVQKLLDEGADVNAKLDGKSAHEYLNGGTALHHAVQCGRVNIVQLLVDNGADVNVLSDAVRPWPHPPGATPLCIASRMFHPAKDIETVQILLAHGADPNIPNEKGQMPLHIAVNLSKQQYHADAVVKLLLGHGADVFAQRQGETPEDLEYADFGLTGGNVCNSQYAPTGTFAGDTPLHIAIRGHHLARVRMLLDHGATSAPWSVLAETLQGETPEDLASVFGFDQRGTGDTALYLRDETRKRRALRQLAQCEAFAMGQHERLGAESIVMGLGPDVVRMIQIFILEI